MFAKKFNTYYYYGTGVDQINAQHQLAFILDTALYNELKDRISASSTMIEHWQNLNATPKEAVTMVNQLLDGSVLNNSFRYYFLDPETDPETSTAIAAANAQMNAFGFGYNKIVPKTGLRTQFQEEIYFLNGESPTNWLLNTASYIKYTVTPGDQQLRWYIDAAGSSNRAEFALSLNNEYLLQYSFKVLPEDFFLSDGVNTEYATAADYVIQVNIIGKREAIFPYAVQNVTEIEVTCYNEPGYIYSSFTGMPLTGDIPEEDDISNPYGVGGSSGIGGGDGTLKPEGADDIDPALVASLPGISAADLGFITMYNPTVGQLKSLSSFMWSGAFDLATYKKLFSDPMQSIIGLAIVPVAPSIAGSKNVMFGSIDSGISMSYLSSNYVQLNCGSVAIEKYVGCFMDNDPYTKISIYLPFIGIRQLSADDVIGGSIEVVYNIDVLSGACACFINHSIKGVLYSYNGSCITNVPLTSINFSGAIQNAVTAVGSAIGVVAGMATGAAPLTAMSAVGLATSAANTAINSKPTVQRSGNLGGSAGILSIMKPYVIIERPNMSVPSNVQHYVGQTSNITMKLSACSGFTMCEFVHIDGVAATSEEILEIESLLKAGVIL